MTKYRKSRFAIDLHNLIMSMTAITEESIWALVWELRIIWFENCALSGFVLNSPPDIVDKAILDARIEKGVHENIELSIITIIARHWDFVKRLPRIHSHKSWIMNLKFASMAVAWRYNPTWGMHTDPKDWLCWRVCFGHNNYYKRLKYMRQNAWKLRKL